MTTKHGRSVTRNCGQTAEAAVTDDDRTAGFSVIEVRHAGSACSDDNQGVVRHRSRIILMTPVGVKLVPEKAGTAPAKVRSARRAKRFVFIGRNFVLCAAIRL